MIFSFTKNHRSNHQTHRVAQSRSKISSFSCSGERVELFELTKYSAPRSSLRVKVLSMLPKYWCGQSPKEQNTTVLPDQQIKANHEWERTQPPRKGSGQAGSDQQGSQFTMLCWSKCTEHRAHSSGLGSIMPTSGLAWLTPLLEQK